MTRKVAIVGAGIGAEHLRAYLSLPDRFEVACICDVDLDRANRLALPHGIAVQTEFERLVDDSQIDIVDICLPPHLHLEASLATLEAGKHVICEKPLVTSLSDMDALSAKERHAAGTVFPVFQYRYGLGTAQLFSLIDADLAGRCFAGSLETHWSRDAEYYSIPWRGTWAGEQGGALLGHAIHIHDLLTAILGPVGRVTAETATNVNEIEVEDCAAVSIKMASGALVTSSVTLGAADNTSRLRLMFEGFTVESDHAPYAPAANPWKFTARAPCAQEDIDAVLGSVAEPLTGFSGLLKEVADQLDGHPSRAVSIEEGRRSIEFVTAAYQSARTGKAVSLPISADSPLYAGWRPRAG